MTCHCYLICETGSDDSHFLSLSRVPVLVLSSIPADMSDNLMAWYDESYSVFGSLKEVMLSSYSERMQRLHDMPKKAVEFFWWLFTPHKLVPEEIVIITDCRCDENFSVHKGKYQDVMIQQFDACASWWTQGPDAALQIEMARDMAYTAARFGHLMFPTNVCEPILKCASSFLKVSEKFAGVILGIAFLQFLRGRMSFLTSRGSENVERLLHRKENLA
ncbi:hypothetical protein DCAR_0625541 [Daucus carota subsp. sativus]|uniref:Uncharacterized protein n=1 Tax=Daucus carota subsp. sativus TaxID=79200 RepID=A0AAF0XDV9_DAUCS|nr:PREDICTED: bifunctional dethiobiotin synthetase/7,8-diamino-pelargonic acid aminotransferase, mitochondrial-like isoform X2 [Daucus carota subsp. sativus]WOH06118.1 hypothetical protein DCAR_0625541 [Daucus carota subsp. sativus]